MVVVAEPNSLAEIRSVSSGLAKEKRAIRDPYP